jgi:hypothetical protein
LCLKSFIDHGLGFTLYSYDDVEVPLGVEVHDARRVLPASRIFTYQTGLGTGSVAAFSNLFRYKLLAENGGWWVDTDVLCLHSSLPPHDVVFGWEEDHLYLGNAVLKFPRKHWMPERLYATAEAMIQSRGHLLEWGEIGPRLLTRVATEGNVLDMASPSFLFYPISWPEANLVRSSHEIECVQRRTKNSVFFHLWNEMFRRADISPWALPPAGSYLASMLSKHGISPYLPKSI